jgi:spore maturation protein CgeB
MRLLLVGDGRPYHLGGFFRQALDQLDYEYLFVDEATYFEKTTFLHRIANRLIGRPLGYAAFNHAVLESVRRLRPHVVLVIKGSYLNPEVLKSLKALAGSILVNYSTDDPFNRNASTKDIVDAIPLYDIIATPRRANMADFQLAGAQNLVHVRFGYDPKLHYPEEPLLSDDVARWKSDVVFIGGADRDRIEYLEAIADLPDVDLRLYGGYWNRYPKLQPHYGGFALGRDYRLALSGSKLAICLVRRANRDGHVMRTFEIPACGTFMLAERTEEHLNLFREDEEMVCFTSANEMVEKIRFYLTNENKRLEISQKGFQIITEGKHTYKDRFMQLLQVASGHRDFKT